MRAQLFQFPDGSAWMKNIVLLPAKENNNKESYSDTFSTRIYCFGGITRGPIISNYYTESAEEDHCQIRSSVEVRRRNKKKKKKKKKN